MALGSRPTNMRPIFAAHILLRLSRARRAGLQFSLVLVSAALLFSAAAAQAQFSAPQTTQVHDPSALKPPAGARVAIVEFADMECPLCASTNPSLMEAAAKYGIPWIRHDFPLPYHVWGFQASVYARYFDTKSEKLGNDYRNYIFANQVSIETLDQLRTWTQKFADEHHVALPFAIDPMGKLSAEVKADQALGQRIGIEHTPTIWIVTNGAHGAQPYTEVVDRSKLFQLIDKAIAETSGH